MARVTVEDCMNRVDNRFALVVLATRRARQLIAGGRPVLENSRNRAPVLALREIATGKVRFDRNVHDALTGKFDKPKTRATVLRPVSFTGPRKVAGTL